MLGLLEGTEARTHLLDAPKLMLAERVDQQQDLCGIARKYYSLVVFLGRVQLAARRMKWNI